MKLRINYLRSYLCILQNELLQCMKIFIIKTVKTSICNLELVISLVRNRCSDIHLIEKKQSVGSKDITYVIIHKWVWLNNLVNLMFTIILNGPLISAQIGLKQRPYVPSIDRSRCTIVSDSVSYFSHTGSWCTLRDNGVKAQASSLLTSSL